nr:bacterial Ig-like domain-containing protein [Treponema sp.]
MKKLSIIMSIFLMIFLSSCDMNITEIERQHNLEYITVDTSDNVKLTYLIGENLKTTGIKVIGHYSDETEQEEDIRLVTFSELDNTKPSDSFPITVNYEGKEASYNVVILEAQVESISLQLPQKLFYQKNEQLDTTGLIVYGNYTNGETLTLEESQYVVDSVDLSEYGPHWVYVRLTSDLHICEAYKIEVQDYSITSIEVTTPPTRLIYMVGEELDLTGMIVIAETDKGVKSTLNEGQYTFSPASIKNLEAADEIKITISVNEAKDDFSIKIVPGYVIGAVVTKQKTKEQIQDSDIIYCEGECFKLEEYDFYELLSNETLGNPIEYSNLQCDINNKTFDKNGIHTVKIKYNFEDVATREQKEYIIEMKVCVVDSKLEKITAKWNDNGGYPLGLLPDNSNPEKYGKWIITGHLKNGTDVEITPNSCTYDFSQGLPEVEKDKENIINNNGAYFDVEVKYKDIRLDEVFKSTCKVKVIPPVLTKIEIKNYPTKLEYCVLDPVNLDGLSVTGWYSDDTKEEQKNTSYDPLVIGKNGTQKITVYFPNGLFIDIPIKVVNDEIAGISLTNKTKEVNVVFRKDKTYGEKVFYDNFDVWPLYNSSNSVRTVERIENYVAFSIDFKNNRV